MFKPELKFMNEKNTRNEWRELLEYGIIWSLTMAFLLFLLIFSPTIFPELVKEISGLINK